MRSAEELPGWLAGAVGDLTGWSAGLDTGVFDPAALPALVTDIERATRLLRSLQARFAEDAVRRGSWRSGGDRSPEPWYARVKGCSIGQARRKLETRQRLDDQPDLDDQVRQGELSDEQAEQVSDAAGDDPDTARVLVAQAKKGSLARLRRECERAKAAKRQREDDETRRQRLHAKRSCRTWTDDEGMACMGARLVPEAMARLLANLDPFTRQAFDEARREGRRESHGAPTAPTRWWPWPRLPPPHRPKTTPTNPPYSLHRPTGLASSGTDTSDRE